MRFTDQSKMVKNKNRENRKTVFGIMILIVMAALFTDFTVAIGYAPTGVLGKIVLDDQISYDDARVRLIAIKSGRILFESDPAEIIRDEFYNQVTTPESEGIFNISVIIEYGDCEFTYTLEDVIPWQMRQIELTPNLTSCNYLIKNAVDDDPDLDKKGPRPDFFDYPVEPPVSQRDVKALDAFIRDGDNTIIIEKDLDESPLPNVDRTDQNETKSEKSRLLETPTGDTIKKCGFCSLLSNPLYIIMMFMTATIVLLFFIKSRMNDLDGG